MFEMTIQVFRSQIKVVGENEKDLIRQSAFFCTLPTHCPSEGCGGDQLQFMFREFPAKSGPLMGKLMTYYSIRCLDCGAKCNFGVHQDKEQTLYYDARKWTDKYNQSLGITTGNNQQNEEREDEPVYDLPTYSGPPPQQLPPRPQNTPQTAPARPPATVPTSRPPTPPQTQPQPSQAKYTPQPQAFQTGITGMSGGQKAMCQAKLTEKGLTWDDAEAFCFDMFGTIEIDIARGSRLIEQIKAYQPAF